MSIDFTCECGKQYRVSESLSGRRIRCKLCQAVVVVPAPLADESLLVESPYEVEYGLSPTVAPDDLAAWQTTPTIGTDNTRASLPVQLLVNWPHVLLSFWKETLLLGGGLLLLPLAAWVMGPALFLPWVFVLLAILHRVNYTRGRFAGGDLVPAIVVAENPWRVAVYTDLTTSEYGDVFPAIKIVEQPLERMTAGPPRVGMPLAAAALYMGDVQQPHWANFFPVAINCAVANPLAIQTTVERIPQELWLQLAARLKQVPARAPGLYTLWDNNLAGRRSAKQRANLGWIAAVVCLILAGGTVVLAQVFPGRAGGQQPAAAANNQLAQPQLAQPQPIPQFGAPVIPAPPAGAPAPAASAPIDPAQVAPAPVPPRRLRPDRFRAPAPPVPLQPVTVTAGQKVEMQVKGEWLPGTVIGIRDNIAIVRTDHDLLDHWVTPNLLRLAR